MCVKDLIFQSQSHNIYDKCVCLCAFMYLVLGHMNKSILCNILRVASKTGASTQLLELSIKPRSAIM